MFKSTDFSKIKIHYPSLIKEVIFNKTCIFEITLARLGQVKSVYSTVVGTGSRILDGSLGIRWRRWLPFALHSLRRHRAASRNHH